MSQTLISGPQIGITTTAVHERLCCRHQFQYSQYSTACLISHPHCETLQRYRGVVGPQSWQLLGLCFQSDQKGVHTARLTCVINSNQVCLNAACASVKKVTPKLKQQMADCPRRQLGFLLYLCKSVVLCIGAAELEQAKHRSAANPERMNADQAFS